MALGVTNGGIADAPQFTVTAPDPLKVSPTLRAQRVLGDFLATFPPCGIAQEGHYPCNGFCVK